MKKIDTDFNKINKLCISVKVTVFCHANNGCDCNTPMKLEMGDTIRHENMDTYVCTGCGNAVHIAPQLMLEGEKVVDGYTGMDKKE